MIITFFTAIFSSSYWFGSWLNTTSLIALAATGAIFALQSGNMNLGGESQIYLGGFLTAIWLNKFLPASQGFTVSLFYVIFVFITGLILAIMSGAIITFLAALLKKWHGINEMITTFLFSAALIPILDYAITNPFRDTSQNLLATPKIADPFKIPHLLNVSDLNTSFIFIIILIIGASYILYHTMIGEKFRICGMAPEFAFSNGYRTNLASCTGLTLSGALHALTGFIAVVGTYYACYKDFYVGIGWNALSTALIAQSNLLLVLPVSLVLSFLYTSSDAVMLTTGSSFDFESLLQGIILIFVSVQVLKRKTNFKRTRTK